MVSREDLPPDQASLSVRRQLPAEGYYWPYRKVVVPSLVAFAAAGLIIAWSLVSQPVNGFDLAGFAVACVWVGRAGEVVACLATTALLIAAARRPRWRRALTLAIWSTFALQIGFLILAATQYPGNSCRPQPGWAAITLTDQAPGPTLVVPPGAPIIVTVPGSGPGPALDVTVSSAGILREDCTVLLPGGGRRTIFAAIKPGTTFLGSTVEPFGGPMPAWSGKVIVRGSRA